MGSTRRLSITLPTELARLLSQSVAEGKYETESDVVEAGLRVILGQDREFERWLQQEAGPAYDAIEADPSLRLTIEQVRSALAARHAETLAGE